MHALAAHGYHLLLRAAHLATLPAWPPLLAALAIALAVRAAGRSRLAAPGAAAAVLAGWAVMAPLATWPPPPVARLPGLAAIILAQTALPVRAGVGWPAALAVAALAAWWLCGAPASGAALTGCLPVLVGLLAGLAAARRLAQGDAGWATLSAALALAGSLRVTGAAPHWALAALVPAIVALALLGLAAAAASLAGLVVCVATAALVASDRGRLLPVDAACLAPLLALALVGRLAGPSGRGRSAVACALAALSCVSLVWITTWL